MSPFVEDICCCNIYCNLFLVVVLLDFIKTTCCTNRLLLFPSDCEDFIFSFASNATKKISESVAETAHNIKKTVEEGKIDGIIDKACCSSGFNVHGRLLQRRIFTAEMFVYRLSSETSRRNKRSLFRRRRPESPVRFPTVGSLCERCLWCRPRSCDLTFSTFFWETFWTNRCSFNPLEWKYWNINWSNSLVAKKNKYNWKKSV